MSKINITIINGSPRANKNSCAFARSIEKTARRKKMDTEIFWVMKSFSLKSVDPDLIESIEKSGLIIFISPLYADFITYPMVWMMEQLKKDFNNELKGKVLFGISQCAFPYWKLNIASLNAMSFFAEECGMRWYGGLGYGGAAFIDGKNLEEIGKSGRKLIKAFDSSLEFLLKNKKISFEIQKSLEIKVPRIFTRPLAWLLNKRIKKMCLKKRVKDPAIKSYL